MKKRECQMGTSENPISKDDVRETQNSDWHELRLLKSWDCSNSELNFYWEAGLVPIPAIIKKNYFGRREWKDSYLLWQTSCTSYILSLYNIHLVVNSYVSNKSR